MVWTAIGYSQVTLGMNEIPSRFPCHLSWSRFCFDSHHGLQNRVCTWISVWTHESKNVKCGHKKKKLVNWNKETYKLTELSKKVFLILRTNPYFFFFLVSFKPLFIAISLNYQNSTNPGSIICARLVMGFQSWDLIRLPDLLRIMCFPEPIRLMRFSEPIRLICFPIRL